MALECEEFFIKRIKDGLADTAAPLTEREEAILRTRVPDLRGVDAAELRRLQGRCISSLRGMYAQTIEIAEQLSKSGAVNYRGMSPTDYALEWREKNVQLYESSNRVVSAIVQEWYLTVGRKQELRVSPVGRLGCGAAMLLVLLAAGAAGVLFVGC